MKFGIRKFSLAKRISARTSLKRQIIHRFGLKMPRGLGILRNPKKAIYNKVYNQTTISLPTLFKKLIGNYGLEEETKKHSKEEVKKGRNRSNEFIESLNTVINQAKELVYKSLKSKIIQEAVNIEIEGFFYSNLIMNFKNNLTEDNLKECNITEEDVKNIEESFGILFGKCKNILGGGSNNKEINKEVYKNFREEINKISRNTYNLLNEIENHIDISSCESLIYTFKKDIKNLSKG